MWSLYDGGINFGTSVDEDGRRYDAVWRGAALSDGLTPEGCGDSLLSVNLTADSDISSAEEALSGPTWDWLAPEDLFHLLLLV